MPGQPDAQKVRQGAREPGMADHDPASNQESVRLVSSETTGSNDVNVGDMAEEAMRRVEAVAEELRSQAAVGPDFGLADLGPSAVELDGSSVDLSMLHDVDLRVTIELGRTRMAVEDVVRLDADSVIELEKAAGDPVDVYVNGRHVACGEVLVLNDNFCIRVSEIIPLATMRVRPDEVMAVPGTANRVI
jgi:flagellar motor switch protein FliN/FliY